jgi:hypothetical protein
MQHPRSLIVLLAVLASGGLAARASAAPATANPCKVLAGTAIAATVDWGSSLPAGTLSSRPDGQAKQLVCTFKKGTGTLELTLAPHQGPGGFGGPPGMVVTRPSGLGTGAIFAYDTRTGDSFANASFTKGDWDGSVWDNGALPPSVVLALARTYFKALP